MGKVIEDYTIDELIDLSEEAGVRGDDEAARRVEEAIDWRRGRTERPVECPTGETWPWTCGGGVPAKEGR